MRSIGLHTFCSAKGGVGKSALAVACAKLLARSGRDVVLIDADMTGTSLADGLDLCAPAVTPDPRGGYSFEVAPTRHLTRAETWHARYARAVAMMVDDDGAPRPPPPFLNDLLIGALDEDPAVPVASMLWRHERDDGVGYLPSSPITADLVVAARWLNHDEGERWVRQLAWLLDLLVAQRPTLCDVVFDLPPGLFGFAAHTIALCSHLAAAEGVKALPEGFPRLERHEARWVLDPVLVTSQDRNDLSVAVEWYVRHRADVPTLRLVANRLSRPIDDLRHRAKSTLGALGLQGNVPIEGVGLLPDSLGAIFNRSHDLDLSREVQDLAAVLRVEVPR